MKVAEQRLFAPGTGAAPPALTGREQEQGVLSLCLSDLTRGDSPPHDVVMIGPRGNGKTALLRWFERTCLESRRKVNVVRVTAADLPDRATMLARLAPRSASPSPQSRCLGLALGGVDGRRRAIELDPAVDRKMPPPASRGAH